MLALKLDRRSLTDFTTHVEKLSSSLRRSLIMEGVSAQEMTVTKVI